MIVDASALVAIWCHEPGCEELSEFIRQADSVRISAATFVELCAVIDNRAQPENQRRLDSLLELYGIEVEPFTAEQAAIARAAYRDYGKGSGHPAHLNLGDCFSYALASARGEPLLFVGDDFGHTDVRKAA